MYLKRLLALLCSLALVFCLLPSTAFAEGGNGNIDGGGGSMGQGTSSNFWNPGNDGVRITVVDADSGNAISSPIDFTNRSQNNVVHFGKVNKLQYLAGTALTPQSGAGYDYTSSLPTGVYGAATGYRFGFGVTTMTGGTGSMKAIGSTSTPAILPPSAV